MIITVTLNAAIDRTLAVPNFRLGRRHRSVEQRSMAGGKGVNVARSLKKLGQPVIATGVAGGPTGTRIIEQLTEEAILNDFVRIREESRTSIAVVDPTSGEQTEINERGPTVSEAELELFVDKLLYLAKGAAVCVFSGSLPRGVPTELYAELIAQVNKLGVTTVLDSEGEALRLATKAAPSVVTPNELEAEELVGHEFSDDSDHPDALREIAELGAEEAILTLPSGCVAYVGETGDRRLYRATIEPGVVETVSAVGAGDAFLAGYVASRYGGRPADECLRFAVACGADSIQHFGAGVIDPKEVGRLIESVTVEALTEPVGSVRG
jgi:1-phosphofructokinase/tagatose 6-phosphate kinase